MALHSIPENPVPDGAEAGLLESPDGIYLRYAHWRPEFGQCLGTVCLFQGRGEFIEKYFEVIEELLQRRFAVATFDWRGQGGSARLLRNPLKGHVQSFKGYDRDFDLFMRDLVLPDCPPPYFALAHSMGANIVLRSLSRTAWFDRIVGLAPMIALRQRILPWPVVRFIGRGMKAVGLGSMYVPGGSSRPKEKVPFARNPLTGDRERFDRAGKIIDAHPTLAVGSPTVSWLVAALAAMEELQTADLHAGNRTPVLLVQAGYDQVVSNKEIGMLAAHMPGGADVFLEGAFHEILMERRHIREQFWAAFDTFVPGTVVQHPALRTSNAFW